MYQWATTGSSPCKMKSKIKIKNWSVGFLHFETTANRNQHINMHVDKTHTPLRLPPPLSRCVRNDMLLDFGPSLAQLLVLRFCCSANSSNGVTWASSTPLPFSTNIRRVYRHTRTNFTKNRRRCCCWRERKDSKEYRKKQKKNI
jgi:hypothetical protein